MGSFIAKRNGYSSGLDSFSELEQATENMLSTVGSVQQLLSLNRFTTFTQTKPGKQNRPCISAGCGGKLLPVPNENTTYFHRGPNLGQQCLVEVAFPKAGVSCNSRQPSRRSLSPFHSAPNQKANSAAREFARTTTGLQLSARSKHWDNHRMV